MAGFLLLVVGGGAPAAGQEEAPRRPPEPFPVFVHAGETEDADLATRIAEATPMVRQRVERRRAWFRMADSAEDADITLRVVNYRVGSPRELYAAGRFESLVGCPAMEFHFVDAVALAGAAREFLSGLDHRCIDTGPSLRNAASHLAEELERFAKEHYGTLRQLRTRTPRSSVR